MAQKISQMTDAGTLTGNELVPMVKSGQNVISTTQEIADLASGGGNEDFETLTYGATTNWNLATGQKKILELTGNTILNVTGATGVGWGLLKLIQDSTGGRTVTFPGKMDTGFTLDTEPAAEAIVGFVNVEGTLYWFGSNYEPEEILELLEDKVFESLGDWTHNGTSINNEDAGINKLEVDTSSTFKAVYKDNIFTVGDSLKVTIDVNIITGNAYLAMGGSGFNQNVTELIDGVNSYDIDTTGASDNYTMIGAGGSAPGIGHFYVRSIKIEKYP